LVKEQRIHEQLACPEEIGTEVHVVGKYNDHSALERFGKDGRSIFQPFLVGGGEEARQ
jgi:hypothetical protein